MAVGVASCTCERCGARFEKRATRANRREADSWVAWAEENITVCPDCYRAEKAAKAEAEIEKATAEIGLAELEGSVKQVSWATDIRNKFIVASASFLASVHNEDEKVRLIRRREIVLKKAKDSRWWIENRYFLEGGNIPVIKKKPANA